MLWVTDPQRPEARVPSRAVCEHQLQQEGMGAASWPRGGRPRIRGPGVRRGKASGSCRKRGSEKTETSHGGRRSTKGLFFFPKKRKMDTFCRGLRLRTRRVLLIRISIW